MATPVVKLFEAPDYGAEINRAARLLRDGGLVVLPTETVYGVAAVASHPEAVRKLRQLRNGAPVAEESAAPPLTPHLARPADAGRYLSAPSQLARRMIGKLWPGPVALTFDVPAEQRDAVCRSLEVREGDIFAGDRLTLRCPSHPVATDVIDAVGGLPVVLTLAGGDASAARQVDQFLPQVDGKVQLVLDAGPTQYSKPSTIIHVGPEHYRIERAGIYDDRIIERLLRTTILFVCSGNTCRSPMAEAIARKRLADRLGVPQDQLESRGFAVYSAGAYALPGARATPAAVDAVAAMGGDLSRHRSRMLSPELVNAADAIYAMGKAHRQAVLALAPSAAGKVVTLDPEQDIEDPIGGDASLYRELAGDLSRLIDRRLDELIALGVSSQHPAQPPGA